MLSEEDYKEVTEELIDNYPDMMFYEHLEGALIGHVQIFNKSVALYDYNKCIEYLMELGEDVTYEMASDHVFTNSIGAWYGENTPGFFFPAEQAFKPSVPDTLSSILIMTEDERVELFEKLRVEMCLHCKRLTPNGETCHCWNDE